MLPLPASPAAQCCLQGSAHAPQRWWDRSIGRGTLTHHSLILAALYCSFFCSFSFSPPGIVPYVGLFVPFFVFFHSFLDSLVDWLTVDLKFARARSLIAELGVGAALRVFLSFFFWKAILRPRVSQAGGGQRDVTSGPRIAATFLYTFLFSIFCFVPPQNRSPRGGRHPCPPCFVTRRISLQKVNCTTPRQAFFYLIA